MKKEKTDIREDIRFVLETDAEEARFKRLSPTNRTKQSYLYR